MRWLHKIGLLLALVGFMSPALGGPQGAASEFVHRQGLGRNLRTLAQAAVNKTNTFAMLASKLGTSEAQLLVSKELDAYALQFESQWNANLAEIYARHLSAEELASLASEGRKSRYIDKLNAKRDVIGTEMQRLSQPILIAYVSAALGSASSKSARK
ncbi:MAG: hypothetical protein ABIQ08_10600 [Duganella sp.]